MCGISGILDLKQKPVSREKLEKMTSCLAHRGPNDEGIFIDGPVGLGHRRLSILDLSPAGRQPMSLKQSKSQNLKPKSSNIWIIFNGEIYNYLELRQEIGGQYQTGTDTEVILRAHDKWGEKCLEKFNGIFAFAIWDAENKKLFCARDRIGVKPFYYAVKNGVFYFASEIKALLAAGIKAEHNDKIIYDYLVHGFYEHSEDTFFKGIKQLMPGHALEIRNSKLEIQRYWYLPERVKDLSNLSDEEVSRRYTDLVTDAIKIQMRSDVPIGINVSGGLDSSILTETVDRICGGQKNFQLYSWLYGEKKYDEKPYVQKLADHLGWDVKFFKLTPKIAEEIMPEVMAHEEQPFPGISIVARHNLYRNTDKETIVFLEGHGGDEIGGGYEYYFASFILDVFKKHGAERARQELMAYARLRGIKNTGEVIKFFMNGLVSYFKGGTSADASSFVNIGVLNNFFVKSAKNEAPKFEQPFKSFLANMQYRDLSWTKEPRVLRSVDRNSMAYGKEVRVPFLDHRIVEFAFSLPLEQKIRNGEQRFFMREAFRKRLAHHNVNLPKRAVPDPQRDWLKNEMRPWAKAVLSSKSFSQRGYFNQKKVLEEYGKYCKSENPANSFHIWQWINLELWFRTFIN